MAWLYAPRVFRIICGNHGFRVNGVMAVSCGLDGREAYLLYILHLIYIYICIETRIEGHISVKLSIANTDSSVTSLRRSLFVCTCSTMRGVLYILEIRGCARKLCELKSQQLSLIYKTWAIETSLVWNRSQTVELDNSLICINMKFQLAVLKAEV